jgi:beta-lactam-binding protein with PASTA domain
MTEAGAEATLAAQPLAARVVYKPAKPGTLPGLVVDQDPRRGGLSAHDEVTVVVSKARFGVLPNFVGSSVADAQREAKRLKVRLIARTAPGREGTVLRQVPGPAVAVAPGMRVRLVVGDGSRS